MFDGAPREPLGLIGYDAAQGGEGRSNLIFPRNSRVEYNRWTRRLLLEKSRAIEGNFAFVTRLRSKIGRCEVGKGIFPYPVTKDEEWNQLNRARFDRWASNPAVYAVDASIDMWEDQRIAAEQLGAGDGEHFEVKTLRDGRPMMQPLDPFEIESPWGNWGVYEDGVRHDEYLKPVGYSCRTLPSPVQPYEFVWKEIPATALIHLFRRRRAKQFRGLPPLYSSMNDSNDAMDTLALEKATAKLHAALGVSKTVKAVNKGMGLTGQIEKHLRDHGHDGKDGPERQKLLEKFWQGGATIELDEGEELNLITSSRPSQPVIEGVKFYCELVALSADLPLSVVLTMAGLGGTPTRAEMEDAQSTFEMGQDRIVWRHSQPVYTWNTACAIEAGEIRPCRDPYWWATDWHGPAKITCDYGRTADANIKLSRNGMLSHPRYFEERGQDADTEMDKQIAFLKRTRDKCEAAEVPFELIFEPTPGTILNPTDLETPDPGTKPAPGADPSDPPDPPAKNKKEDE
jgi:capsid protein